MKDRFFYPLALLMIASIIALALSFKQVVPPLTQTEIIENGFVVKGQALGMLTASPGTKVEIKNIEGGLAVISSQIVKTVAPPSAGVFVTLGPDYEKAFANRLLEIQVRAKRGNPKQETTLEIAYFSAGAENSGWTTFELTEDFEIYTLFFRPGVAPDRLSQNYLGLWPDPSGQNKTVSIASISVKPVADKIPP